MPNPQDIFQLAQQTATQVTASPENWRRFLYTAAHNYHTTYLNQLLIHAQRPDATACATMKYWNEQAHRKVMYGSKSIIILQRHQGVPTAKRVFSMTDTVLTGDKAAAPWEVTDVIRPLLMQVNSVGSLMDRATEQVISLSERANRVLATSIEDSTLGWSHPEDQRFILQELAAQSTLYMICIRLGIPVQEEDFTAFQNVTQFDTSRISLCLGGYVQAAAEPLLDELGHEVMQLARDSVAIQAEPVHNTDTQSPTQTTSREEAVTDDVHEREGLSDSEPELAESQENQPEPVRQDAAVLLGAERAEPVRPDDAGGNAAAELPQDGAGCAADGGQDAARSDAESADARPQDEPSGLGTDVQQPEAAGGGNDPSDAVRSITEEPAAAESEPSPSAFSLPEFPAELLPSLLKADTTSRASNADILDIYLMQTQAISIPILSAATMISAASISGKSILFSSRGQIKGLTTSAALWSCAALGFTIGAGLYTVTLIVFAFLLCILSAFPTIEVYLKNRSNHFEIHLELKNIEYLRDFVTVSRRLGLRIDDIESNPAYVGSGLSVYTITVTICSSELKKYKTHHEIIEALKSLDYIYHLEELR